MVGIAMQDKAEPPSGRGPMTPKIIRPRRIILIVCPVLLAAIVFAALFLAASARPNTIIYRGKTLDAWFYGSRKDFFNEPTRKAAQEAIDGLGTNAFPFLFYTLKHSQGNNALYFKLYQAMPKQVQAKLPYPISGDDIRAMTLMHISQMRGTREVAPVFAGCVSDFDNPRLRMVGFNIMLMRYQTDAAFLKLCRKLLNDGHLGIELQAAVYLAQSAIVSDPGEPRLFPILLVALESREQRKLSLNLNGYFYQQHPPGSPGPSAFIRPPQLSQGLADPDEMLRGEILRALARLNPYLNEEQKNRFKQVRQTQSESKTHY
jgi:hypothetical protein